MLTRPLVIDGTGHLIAGERKENGDEGESVREKKTAAKVATAATCASLPRQHE